MSKSFAGYEIDQAKTAKMTHTLQQIIVITHDVNMDDIPTELRSIWSDVSLYGTMVLCFSLLLFSVHYVQLKK
jgi:hypothetical protein